MQNGLPKESDKSLANSLRISTSSVVTLLLVLSACGRGGPETNKNNICVNSSRGVCVVSFQQVASERHLLIGTNLSTKGYLQREGDEFSLYLTSELARYGIREGGIKITTPKEYFPELAVLNEKYVAVTGDASSSTQWLLDLNLTLPPSELPELFNELPPAPPRPSN